MAQLSHIAFTSFGAVGAAALAKEFPKQQLFAPDAVSSLGKVLRAVNHVWEKEQREVYSRTLRQELQVEFSQVKDAEEAARDTLDQLADKGLLDKQKPTLEGKGDVVLFRPYGADLSKSDMSALWKYPPVPLKGVQLQKGFIHCHSFSGDSSDGKRVQRVFLQSTVVMR